MFQQYGFSENDLFWVHHKPIVVSGEKKYSDIFGNKASLSKGCTAVFEGYNCNVLAEKINVSQSLKIYCSNNAAITIGENTSISGDFRITAKELAATKLIPPNISIGTDVKIDYGTITSFSGEINIGNKCTFGKNIGIVAGYGMGIFLGRDCMFSHDIWLFSGDGHQIFDLNTKENINSINNIPEQKRYIQLGEHVWCGLRACILNGTKVGNGSVIGANSLVKGCFTNNCIIAGNPAKEIKRDISWSRQPVDGSIESCGQEYMMFSQ